MVNYRAILLYYHQGNTTTQIATICECSRTTVIKTIKRAKQLDLKLPIADSISDQELYVMLYPKRGRRKEYYLPDWYLLDKDKIKRSFTKFRAWQKYCRVAAKKGLKAYGKSRFYKLYHDYFSPLAEGLKAKLGNNLSKIAGFSLAEKLFERRNDNNQSLIYLERQKEEWCILNEQISINRCPHQFGHN